jgi:hypothetical protein
MKYQKKKLLRNVPVVLHLNNNFQEHYLPDQEFSVDEFLIFWKGFLSNSICLSRHPNLELKLTSCVRPSQGIYGPSLYIQLMPIKQQPLFGNWQNCC